MRNSAFHCVECFELQELRLQRGVVFVLSIVAAPTVPRAGVAAGEEHRDLHMLVMSPNVADDVLFS